MGYGGTRMGWDRVGTASRDLHILTQRGVRVCSLRGRALAAPARGVPPPGERCGRCHELVLVAGRRDLLSGRGTGGQLVRYVGVDGWPIRSRPASLRYRYHSAAGRRCVRCVQAIARRGGGG